MALLLPLLALLGGLLPALVWLFFWLLEDRCQPEPKRYIFYSFVAGMVAVAPTLIFQEIAQQYLEPSSTLQLGAWALTEEVMIFAAAYFAALRSIYFDEPIDAIIYLVTAALGFSALENALFLWTPLAHGELLKTFALGESRFMGATLVHAFSSSTVGIALALSFSKPPSMRVLYGICGLILAATLHTTYNYFILSAGSGQDRSQETFWIFACVWFGIIATLLVLERLKQPNDYC